MIPYAKVRLSILEKMDPDSRWHMHGGRCYARRRWLRITGWIRGRIVKARLARMQGARHAP